MGLPVKEGSSSVLSRTASETVHKVLGGGIPLESLSFGFTGLGLFFEL